MTDADDVIALSLLALVVLLIVGIGVVIFRTAEAQSECLAAGYPAHKIDFKLNQYCIRRVDQTDEVIRLDKVRGVVP